MLAHIFNERLNANSESGEVEVLPARTPKGAGRRVMTQFKRPRRHRNIEAPLLVDRARNVNAARVRRGHIRPGAGLTAPSAAASLKEK